MRSTNYLQLAAIGAVAVVATASFGARSHADAIPSGWEASNMEPVGYSGLENRKGAFKMAIKKVNGRWYLYMGHLWHYGWSIVDVTEPKDPKFLKTISGPGNTWTIQMTLHDNIMVTALEKSSLAWGADPNKPNEEGVLIWDISDPVNPRWPASYIAPHLRPSVVFRSSSGPMRGVFCLKLPWNGSAEFR